MPKRSKISRRAFTQQLGLVAGATLLGPRIASALAATPKQIEGPYYPVDEQADVDLDLTVVEGHAKRATGDVIDVRGRVLDTAGQPLAGTTVDVWQANHWGRYDHPDDPNTMPLDPDFQSWGIVETDADGVYQFRTIKPGAYDIPGSSGTRRARHIHFKLTGPDGQALTTQMYFAGDPLIENDLVMRDLDRDRWSELIVEPDASEVPVFNFDIVLG